MYGVNPSDRLTPVAEAGAPWAMLPGRDLAERGAIALPGRGGRRTGHEVEADDRNREAIDHRLAIAGQVEHAEDSPTDQVERRAQVAAPAIEPAQGGQMGEEVA